MAYMVNMILVAIVVCSIVKGTAAKGAQVQNNDNSEQFALLCRIYNVAKNPTIHHVDLQDPLKIVNEINAFNASFIDEKQFNETEDVVNSSDAQIKHTTTREAAVAQAILSRITKKAHKILVEIKRVNDTRYIEKVKAEFSQVIFGEGRNESDLCDGVLKGVGERGAACGISGLSHKGNYAGKNLVVDFFCLCAQRTKNGNNEGMDNVCGVQVGGKSKGDYQGWGDAAPLGSPSMWASIKKECSKLLHKHPESTEEGHEILKDFLKHLEMGGVYRWGSSGKDSGRKEGMLGTSVGTNEIGDEPGPVCNGKKGNNRDTHTSGICVYYGPNKWEENIDWLKKLKNALASLESVNHQTATIQRDIEKLHMLLHRAEQIYETTKVITEMQNPKGLTAFPNATPKRRTAYNAAWRHNQHAHFILLVVLL
ncbi:Variant surface glycoprotein [Trypanosoma congolense IL3000]|uniref:Variant surface glycoprotein n=1 Tax=Trypanosoma congolense (strain IL3000) TaxID=1068625 RepID=F9WEB1_TRYCI|nr:Variant surface glycoprotein [Trypanosoma congolense IL3000]